MEIVNKEEIEEFAKTFNLQYYLVSAKENINIEESFKTLATIIKDNYDLDIEEKEEGLFLDDEDERSSKKKCC